MLSRRPLHPILLGATVALLFSTRALAAFHLWDINEVYTNADGTIQFIEFTTVFTGENFLMGERFTSNSSQFIFPNDLVGSTANKKFLIATFGFAALPGAVTPDYVMPDNFIAVTGGDTLTLVNVIVNADQITFGPGVLPTNGVDSLDRTTMNPIPNSPTNFAGQTGSTLVPTNVFVDFSAGSGGFGTAVLPFGTLQEAINAAAPPATINLKAGTTTEIFSGGSAISDALTLVKIPGGGSVIIGGPSARTENRSGFRSKPIAPISSRSGAP